MLLECVCMKIYDFEYAKTTSFAFDDNYCLSKDTCVNVEPKHMHEFYELSYTYQGEGVHVINGISYHVKPGSLILFSKLDNHSFYSIDNLSMINCCFVSTQELKNFPIGEKTLIVSLNEHQVKEIDAIFKILEIELTNKEKNYRTIISSNIDIIFTIMTRVKDDQIATDPIWGNLLAHVLENFKTVTLQDALDIMGMSKSYFCRKFKNQFSVSFLTYVNQIRIQYAQRLLTSTNLSVGQIAEKSGYGSNVCRFYEDFKKFTNTTPHKFKIQKFE